MHSPRRFDRRRQRMDEDASASKVRPNHSCMVHQLVQRTPSDGLDHWSQPGSSMRSWRVVGTGSPFHVQKVCHRSLHIVHTNTHRLSSTMEVEFVKPERFHVYYLSMAYHPIQHLPLQSTILVWRARRPSVVAAWSSLQCAHPSCLLLHRPYVANISNSVHHRHRRNGNEVVARIHERDDR